MSETTHQDAVKKVAGIIRDVKFGMLTTVTSEGHLHSRPMTTQQTEFDGDVWFIGDKRSEAVQDMQARPQVNVSYSHPDRGEYVSLNGAATLPDDPAKLDELWNDAYKEYFEGGRADPNIQLIKIDANGAEFWESDGRVRSLFQLARNLVGGKQNDRGANETVKL